MTILHAELLNGRWNANGNKREQLEIKKKNDTYF